MCWKCCWLNSTMKFLQCQILYYFSYIQVRCWKLARTTWFMLMGFLNSYGYDISWENNATSTNPCIEEQGEQRVVWIRIIKPVSKHEYICLCSLFLSDLKFSQLEGFWAVRPGTFSTMYICHVPNIFCRISIRAIRGIPMMNIVFTISCGVFWDEGDNRGYMDLVVFFLVHWSFRLKVCPTKSKLSQ
jgi:hypothetical protein